MTALTQKALTDASRDVSILSVDYNQSFDRMSAAGRYDWENNDITAERFPITGKGIVTCETKLFHFDRLSSSEDAIEAIEADGWQLAKIEHLLAFGAKYPEEQRKLPIVALGSSARVNGRRVVAYLYRDGSERDLGLLWWNGNWNADCRFLAIRNLSSAT